MPDTSADSYGTAAAAALALTATERARLASIRPGVERAAREARIPLALLLGVAYAESNFLPTAIGRPVGGQQGHGLFQVMLPLHAGEFAGADWRDPYANARVACGILRAAGLGRGKGIVQVLASYGGFSTWLRTGNANDPVSGRYRVDLDPLPYVKKVTSAASALYVMLATGQI